MRLFANLLLQSLKFEPWPVHVGFVVDKVALVQVYLWVHHFSPVKCHCSSALYTFIQPSSIMYNPHNWQDR